MPQSIDKNRFESGGYWYEHFQEFPEKRVRQHVEKMVRDPQTDCWIWQKAVDTFAKRYGITSWKSKSIAAHRLSYMIFVGPIPEGYQVHHKCKVPKCINPDHLEAMDAKTHKEVEADSRHKDVCINGHVQNAETIGYYKGTSKRRCKVCMREHQARYRAAQPPKPPKTHCRRGHEYTDENTRWFRGTRYCKTCHAENTLRYYHEGRATNSPEWSKQAAKEVPLE